MKHTPGPWYWDFEGLGSKDVLVFGKGYPFEMTSEANKRLIAASPDLLEALQEMLNKAYKQNWNDQYPDEVSKAQAAISKALGEE
ncbi:hypothetical protein RJO53_002834 [Enterobacter hormaechei]|nr:hypothetical protein [Enterobacter hormaechei]ELC6543171.1 hypothetical protein [Enterobacter hormaechei]